MEYTHCHFCAHADAHERGCPASDTRGAAPIVALADWGGVSDLCRRVQRFAREYQSGVRLRLVPANP